MFRIGGSGVIKLMKLPSNSLKLSRVACRQLFTTNNKVFLLSPSAQSIRCFSNEMTSLEEIPPPPPPPPKKNHFLRWLGAFAGFGIAVCVAGYYTPYFRSSEVAKSAKQYLESNFQVLSKCGSPLVIKRNSFSNEEGSVQRYYFKVQENEREVTHVREKFDVIGPKGYGTVYIQRPDTMNSNFDYIVFVDGKTNERIDIIKPNHFVDKKELISSTVQQLQDKHSVLFVTKHCGWCEKQIKEFSSFISLLNVVDCSLDENESVCNGIDKFPTWIIKEHKFTGYHTIDELNDLSKQIN